jgi:hypothetical protein
MSKILDDSEWRQHDYNYKKVKRQLRILEKKKRGGSRSAEKQAQIIKQAHIDYIEICQYYLYKAQSTLVKFKKLDKKPSNNDALQLEHKKYMEHAKRQIEQITLRVLEGKPIPHNEKVFSIHQPHTEWIVKGKAGVPQELGIKVSIMEDSHQFILHHKVMEKQSDSEVAVYMVEETIERFKNLGSVSFDRGYHSPDNQDRLKELLKTVALPRKGKLSKEAKEIESSGNFKKAKNKHSAVESAINGLQVHGLNKCLDHGIEGFKRYVALAMVARNIQRIGVILQQNEIKDIKRKERKLLRTRAA